MSKERAAQLVDAGLWLKLSGDHEGAQRLFEQALRYDPANVKAQQQLNPKETAAASQQQDWTTPSASPFDRPDEGEISGDWGAATGQPAQSGTTEEMFGHGFISSPETQVPESASDSMAMQGAMTIVLDGNPSSPSMRPPFTPPLFDDVPRIRTPAPTEVSQPPAAPRPSGIWSVPSGGFEMASSPSRPQVPVPPPPPPSSGVWPALYSEPSAADQEFEVADMSLAVDAAQNESESGAADWVSESGFIELENDGTANAVELAMSTAPAWPPPPPLPSGQWPAPLPPDASEAEPPPAPVGAFSPSQMVSVDTVTQSQVIDPDADARDAFDFDSSASLSPEFEQEVEDRRGHESTAPSMSKDPKPAYSSSSVSGFATISQTARASVNSSHIAQEVAVLLRGVQELQALDDHSGALELLDRAAKLSPADSTVTAMIEKSHQTLLRMYESKLGKTSVNPRVLLNDDEIIWLNLDHRAGFVLSQIDGQVSFDDLFEISGMSRLDTAKILSQLIEDGVISRG